MRSSAGCRERSRNAEKRLAQGTTCCGNGSCCAANEQCCVFTQGLGCYTSCAK
jgi:hypothetical protein